VGAREGGEKREQQETMSMHQNLRVVGVVLLAMAAVGASREGTPGERGRRACRPTARVRGYLAAMRLHTAQTADSIVRQRRVGRVRPGIDVLLTDSAQLVVGRRVGLITNQSGIDRNGVPTIDRLARFPGVRLAALFAPEHGIRGVLDEAVRDTVDPATGIPIYSLYGARPVAPTPGQLRNLDVLVVDLQDVGTRTWTYVTTTILAMRAARTAGKRILVLDRPNPIGCVVRGPVLDTAYASFIGPLPVPLRHGMTMGELARFANAELRIGADLVVVPVSGWRRCQWLDETGLPFVRPSPNLPDIGALSWYPGTVLFEATNLSSGRGTDAPFRQVGAPWLDARRVAQRMAERFGVRLLTVRFTPRDPGDGKYGDTLVNGVQFAAFDRARGDAIRDALRLLGVIGEVHPGQFRVDSVGVARRLGVRATSGKVEWPDEVRAFLARRRPYLLYR
jgi:uncharacterized protein YbbC (DUF1343 family)